MATAPVAEVGPPVRRRRTPEEARAEILAAARTLLVERPVQEMTVSAIMSATTLSRKSFYVYFPDRAALITELVAPMRADTDEAVEQWRHAPDPVAAGRRALRQAAELYHRDGVVLKALADASQRDPEAAAVWKAITAPLVAVAAEKMAEAMPTAAGLDAEATARALVLMNVHYFLDRLVGAPESEIAPTVEVLAAIWERTIYLRPPDASCR